MCQKHNFSFLWTFWITHIKIVHKAMFLLEIFLTIKVPTFFQKNKNILMLEEVPALQNENNHLNNLVPCVIHRTISNFWQCMNYRNFFRPTINWSTLVHRQLGEECKSNSINMNLRICRKEMFYHTNQAAHFNSAINNQYKRWKKNSFFYLFVGRNEKRKLGNISEAQAKNKNLTS